MMSEHDTGNHSIAKCIAQFTVWRRTLLSAAFEQGRPFSCRDAIRSTCCAAATSEGNNSIMDLVEKRFECMYGADPLRHKHGNPQHQLPSAP